jgi:hypothetical protein
MAQSIYTPPQVEAPTQSSTGRCDHDTAVPWRKQSSRRFFLDEPAPPHSISAPSLDHLIGHREDSRRNGEAVPWRSRHSPNRKPPFREALPTSVAVEAPLAEWVPSADRQDLCRKMRTKPRNRGLSRGEPKVRIHLPPAASQAKSMCERVAFSGMWLGRRSSILSIPISAAAVSTSRSM